MRPRTLAVLLLLALASAGRPADLLADSTPLLQDVEERHGPFRIGGRDFVVVLHLKRLIPVVAAPSSEAALAALEIRDASGGTVHRETFSYTVERGAFSDSCAASVRAVNGGFAPGLLIGVGCSPSAPDSGEVWELFGLIDGRLTRLGKPFTTNGEFLGIVPHPPQRVGAATLFRPDVLQFRVWTGNFRVTVPVRVDWMQGRLGPGLRCFEQTGRGLRESGCEVPVEAERVPGEEDLTFVRLFAEATEGMGVPRHVVIRKDSRVEILAARIKLAWDESREVIVFGADDQDPWLKVRIDGREGWIHTQEDFTAVGVPQAG